MISDLLEIAVSQYCSTKEYAYAYAYAIEKTEYFLSDVHIELIYTLNTQHFRSNETRMLPLEQFRNSIRDNMEYIYGLREYRIECSDALIKNVIRKLWYSLALVKGRPGKLEMFAQTLHLLIPALFIPINRQHTTKFLRIELPEDAEDRTQLECYMQCFDEFASFAKSINDWNMYLDDGWNKYIPLAIDSIIAAWDIANKKEFLFKAKEHLHWCHYYIRCVNAEDTPKGKDLVEKFLRMLFIIKPWGKEKQLQDPWVELFVAEIRNVEYQDVDDDTLFLLNTFTEESCIDERNGYKSERKKKIDAIIEKTKSTIPSIPYIIEEIIHHYLTSEDVFHLVKQKEDVCQYVYMTLEHLHLTPYFQRKDVDSIIDQYYEYEYDKIELYSHITKEANYFNDRGEAYMCIGELENAIADFSQCISKSRNFFSKHYVNRAWAYRTDGQLHKAILDYTTLIENTPSSIFYIPSKISTFYTMRGKVYELLSLFDNMLADYKKAIEIEPLYTEAYYRLADFYFFHKADYENAIAYYLIALEAAPDEMGYTKVIKRISQLSYEDTLLWKEAISRNSYIDKYRLLNAFLTKEEMQQKEIRRSVARSKKMQKFPDTPEKLEELERMIAAHFD